MSTLASTSTSTSSPIPTPTPTTPRSTDTRLRVIVPAVVVPVIVAIILISIIATLFARRRRRARQRGQLADDSTIYGVKKKAELPAEEKNRHELNAWGNEPVRELQDTSLQELPVPVIISELSTHAEQYPEEY